MSEWWTYRPSDFLLFSARTYYRLFELYNAALWPAQLLCIGLGLVLWVGLWRGRAWAPRAACVALGAAWLWVGWGFHWQRFATINWAAGWFAAAFAIEGLLWGWAALAGAGRPHAAPTGTPRNLGLALLLWALLLQPAIGPLTGRPWAQAEVVGLAPDPTALATLGVLLLLPAGAGQPRWPLWPLLLLWCATAGLMLAGLDAPAAWLLPAAAVLAAGAAVRDARARSVR